MSERRRHFTRRASSLALLAMFVSGPACAPERPAAASTITPAELADRLDTGSAPLILDVRSAEEFRAGHIPGAVNVPHDQLAGRLATIDLPPNGEVVVHCESGRRAVDAQIALREAGFTQVRDLSGHMQVWRSKGLPVNSLE
ncbi:MAG: rhodanese-like domain-containing protein [Myxococcota bacterium]